MTVDHLKMLHSKGKKNMKINNSLRILQNKRHLLHLNFPLITPMIQVHKQSIIFSSKSRIYIILLVVSGINGYNYPDPHALAMDYRSVGFRECAAEVARYLVTVEGMDIQDPLRLRLMSHLQCFSAQREAAAKASLQNSSWNGLPSHATMNSQYNGSTMSVMNQPSDQLAITSHPSGLASMPPVSCTDSSRLGQHADSTHSHVTSAMRLPTTGSVAPHMPTVTSSSAQVSPPVLTGLPQVHTQFLSVNSMPMLSPTGTHNYNSHTSLNQTLSAVKPYRPWGTELAY